MARGIRSIHGEGRPGPGQLKTFHLAQQRRGGLRDWSPRCITVCHRWPSEIHTHRPAYRGATLGLALGKTKEEGRYAQQSMGRLWMITWFPVGLQSAFLD